MTSSHSKRTVEYTSVYTSSASRGCRRGFRCDVSQPIRSTSGGLRAVSGPIPDKGAATAARRLPEEFHFPRSAGRLRVRETGSLLLGRAGRRSAGFGTLWLVGMGAWCHTAGLGNRVVNRPEKRVIRTDQMRLYGTRSTQTGTSRFTRAGGRQPPRRPFSSEP